MDYRNKKACKLNTIMEVTELKGRPCRSVKFSKSARDFGLT